MCGPPYTRLETRTKESTVRASTVVMENLFCVLKGSPVIASATGAAPDRLERDVSRSTCGGTRKMVNYS